MKKIIFFITLILGVNSLAFDFEGYIEAQEGHSLFVQHTKAKENKSTFTFINGLIFENERWLPISEKLEEMGYGILLYEFEGQNRSYVKSMEDHKGQPPWMTEGMSVTQNANQLSAILDHLNISKTHIVGLSYGASIAAEMTFLFNEKVDQLVLISPFVISLDYYDPRGLYFRLWFENVRFWSGAMGDFWSNYYFDLVYGWYFKLTPSTRDYDYGPWESQFYKSVLHQVKATKDFRLKNVKMSEKLKTPSIHLITAEKENSLYLYDQKAMWDFWETPIKASHFHVKKAHHSLPDSKPEITKALLLSIASKKNIYFRGKEFIVDQEEDQITIREIK